MALTAARLADRHDAFLSAAPFPHVAIDNFIDAAACRAIAAEYPTFDEAKALGFAFKAEEQVHEHPFLGKLSFPRIRAPTLESLVRIMASAADLAHHYLRNILHLLRMYFHEN